MKLLFWFYTAQIEPILLLLKIPCSKILTMRVQQFSTIYTWHGCVRKRHYYIVYNTKGGLGDFVVLFCADRSKNFLTLRSSIGPFFIYIYLFFSLYHFLSLTLYFIEGILRVELWRADAVILPACHHDQ